MTLLFSLSIIFSCSDNKDSSDLQLQEEQTNEEATGVKLTKFIPEASKSETQDLTGIIVESTEETCNEVVDNFSEGKAFLVEEFGESFNSVQLLSKNLKNKSDGSAFDSSVAITFNTECEEILKNAMEEIAADKTGEKEYEFNKRFLEMASTKKGCGGGGCSVTTNSSFCVNCSNYYRCAECDPGMGPCETRPNKTISKSNLFVAVIAGSSTCGGIPKSVTNGACTTPDCKYGWVK